MFIVWLYLFKNIIQLQGNGMAAISKIVDDLKDVKPREAVLKLHTADCSVAMPQHVPLSLPIPFCKQKPAF